MAAHARVVWAETLEPWTWEVGALETLDLPLRRFAVELGVVGGPGTGGMRLVK